MMEWEEQLPLQAEELSHGGGTGGMFVKVMTDEQMEVLRKQIAVYASICEQLVELHKSLSSQNDLAGTGVRFGNLLYCDPFSTHKMTGRQRWTPTAMQLEILERIFHEGIGTPSKQKIKEIRTELSQHGEISETNVYNWFQNRRARSKRKQQRSNNAESEVEETEVSEKETSKPEESQPRTEEDLCFGQIPSFYGSMLSNPRMDQFIGKIEVPGNVNNPYSQQDEYNMDG